MKATILLLCGLFMGNIQGQQVLVNNSNLHGFVLNNTTHLYLSYAPTGVTTNLDNAGYDTATLDTLLNLTGYDSITVSMHIYRIGCGGSGVNNFWAPDSVLFTTINTTNLSLSIYQGSAVLGIENLRIVGYASVTGVPQETAPRLPQLFVLGSVIRAAGIQTNMKLKLFDLHGKLVFEEDLQTSLYPQLPAGSYIAVLLGEDNSILRRQKIFLSQ